MIDAEGVGESKDADEDGEQRDDDGLEAALAPTTLDEEEPHRYDADDAPAPQEGQAEEEVEGEGTPDDLGEIGRRGHDLGLQPEGDAPGGCHAFSEQGGQGLAGDQAELGGEILDHHREDVGGEEHPD